MFLNKSSSEDLLYHRISKNEKLKTEDGECLLFYGSNMQGTSNIDLFTNNFK